MRAVAGFAFSAAMAMATLIPTSVSGCAGSRSRVRDDDQRAAALDGELAGRAGVRAYWTPDPEYGGMVYVVVAEPPGGTTAPTLVLVHGLGAAGVRDYYPVLASLARGRRVVAFDLPGFGHSSGGNQRYTPARYAAVLSRIINTFAHGPADVMGHSMGGAIALLHAGSYPRQVRRLIVVDAAGILHREAWFGHHLHRVTDPGGLYFPETARSLNDLAGSAMNLARTLDPAPEIVLGTTWLRQKLLGGEPGRIAALALILTDFGAPLSRIVAPTLLVWGAADAVAPLRTGLLLADRLPDATLTVLPGVGHNVMAEATLPLVAAVERHLTAATPAPALALVPPVGPSQGDLHCQGQADLQLSGTYGDVTLDRCARIKIDRAAIGRLVLRDSSAHLIRSTVASGIVAGSSQLMITGGRLQGETALDLTDSAVDLAGVLIDARVQPYRLAGKSKALFSVCTVMTPSGSRHWHGLVDDASAGAAGPEGRFF